MKIVSRGLPLSLILLLAMTRGAAAQDLMQLYDAARQHDAAWLSARAAASAGRERLPQGRSLLLPSITANANTTDNSTKITYEDPAAALNRDLSYNSYGYGVTLTQPLFRPQNIATYRQGKLQKQQADLQLQAAEQDLAVRVAQAYFDVLLAQDTLAFVNAQKVAVNEQWQQAKRSFELGTVTITDANEAEARLDLINAQEIVARSDLEIKLSTLAQIAGVPVQQLSVLGDQFALAPPTPNDLNAWLQNAAARNPNLEIARRSEDIGRREVTKQRAGHLPTIDIVGNYSDTHAGESTFSANSNDTRVTTIGLQLQLPLFQGGAQQSRVREALANRDKAEQDRAQVERQVEIQTRQAYIGVVNGMSQVRALEQALRSSETALKSNRVGFSVGVRTGVDVLNAEQQVYNAKRDLAQARYSYLVSRLRLQAMTGGVDDAAVSDINRNLVPVATAPSDGALTTPVAPTPLPTPIPSAQP